MTNSFRAAYITWDRQSSTSSQPETESEFDYEEFPLHQFYNLVLETAQDFQTGALEQETIIGLEINQNPFTISGEEEQTNRTLTIDASFLPTSYLARDFVSKKNYLGLFIEHEIALSDRLSLDFEGTLDVVISDTTDIPELPSVELVENNNFFPELSLNYELNDHILMFTTIDYAAESIEGTDINDQPFDSEIYQGLELGIEAELNNNWLLKLSFYHETQNNITTIDPNEPNFEVQINEQTSNSWTGEIIGEIVPSWWVYGFYIYTDASVTEDEEIFIGRQVEGIARHSGGFWTSYEITQGVWRGFGFGSGVTIIGDRFGDAKNNLTLPSYVRADAAIFYSQDDFKAAVSIQNLFSAGIEDEEVTERALFATVWFQL